MHNRRFISQARRTRHFARNEYEVPVMHTKGSGLVSHHHNFVKASNAQLSIKCHSSYYLTASVNNCNNT